MQLIVAVDRNWAIGNGNKLLVRIPEDQKFFRETTMGNVVVLGRKTLAEFPNGLPLKGRKNIILSSDKEYLVKDAVVVHSKEELFEELKQYNRNEIFVIGGESIYAMLYEYCDTAHVTKIDYSYQADKYFPNLDEKENWEMTGESDEHTYFDLEYYFYRYENRKPKPID
ncbi:MAG: dihydrofolate reductase [Bacteroidales bacterium]|nr:dihydrofolate reductase [Clostridium sp.]MCM1203986.1 dihydrofolate reductase [Bacteroidales bacterium]